MSSAVSNVGVANTVNAPTITTPMRYMKEPSTKPIEIPLTTCATKRLVGFVAVMYSEIPMATGATAPTIKSAVSVVVTGNAANVADTVTPMEYMKEPSTNPMIMLLTNIAANLVSSLFTSPHPFGMI